MIPPSIDAIAPPSTVSSADAEMSIMGASISTRESLESLATPVALTVTLPVAVTSQFEVAS